MSKSHRSTLSYIRVDPTLNTSLVHLPLSLYAQLTQRQVIVQNIVVQLELASLNGIGNGIGNENHQENENENHQENEKDDGRYFTGWTGMSSTPLLSPIQTVPIGFETQLPPLETVLTISPSLASILYSSSSLSSSTTRSIEQNLIKITLLRSPPIPNAISISVTPHTPDDWEILNLHAQELEDNILAQIRATRKGARIVVRTGLQGGGAGACTFVVGE